MCLSFDRKRDVPPEMLREITTHGWVVANSKAYPTLLRPRRDGSPEPLTPRDVDMAAACATALATLYERYGHCSAADGSEPVSATMQGDDGIEVRFTYPYEAFRQFEKKPGKRGRQAPEPRRAPAVRPQRSSTADIVPFPGQRPRVGRNEPCPCGSGKKYKHCHLDVDEQTRPRQGRRAPVHEVDERLVDAQIEYAERRWGRTWQRLWDRTVRVPRTESLAVPFALYVHPIEGKTVAEWFLEEHGSRLSPAERNWLEAQHGVRLSIWEVLTVESGQGLTLRDAFTGTTHRVHDVQASLSVAPRDILVARVVDRVEPVVLCGVHPRYLSPMAAAPAIERVQARLRRARADAATALLDPKLAGFSSMPGKTRSPPPTSAPRLPRSCRTPTASRWS